jgi:hypothetical protein
MVCFCFLSLLFSSVLVVYTDHGSTIQLLAKETQLLLRGKLVSPI